MKRQIHSLVQGTPEWHSFRLDHDGASEAAAMLGLDKNVSRNELLAAKKSGIAKTFSDFVQTRILDNGHRVEALARPIAESIIGDELSPATYSFGRLSASCDGITFDGSIAFEHKQWNEDLAKLVDANEIPDTHMPQIQQILGVTGANRLLFVVSDGTKQNMAFAWVLPDQNWMARIEAGWAQFHKDLETFEPRNIPEAPKAEPVESFPVPAIHVRGELVNCNLSEITPKFDKFLEETNTNLKTDEDFAQGEADSKASREASKTLKMKAREVIDQIAPVSEVVRTLETYAAKFDALGLKLEKAVKEQKDAIKAAIAAEAREKWQAHLSALDAELQLVKIVMPQPDFGGAMKNVRTIASLHNAVDTLLAQSKIAADDMARDYRAKVSVIATLADYSFLFPRQYLQEIIAKPIDDFNLAVNARLDNYRTEQQKIAAASAAAATAAAVAVPEVLRPELPLPTTLGSTVTGVPAADIAAAVVDHQEEIAAFMKSREFGKEANKVRAILVEFVKFQAARRG
jgi:predicted phage-related endonuclease